LLKGLEGVKLAYAVAKTALKLECEIKALQQALKPEQRFLDFEAERIDLCRKHSIKNVAGKPIMDGREFAGLTGNMQFEEALKGLKKIHFEAIEERERQLKEYQSMLDEEIEIYVHTIKMCDVPEKVTVEQMLVLEKFIEE